MSRNTSYICLKLVCMPSSTCQAQTISFILLKNILLVILLCTTNFNVCRVTLIKGKLTKENLVQHRFLRSEDMPLTENSNQGFLPVVGNHGLFLYEIVKVIICNFV